MSGTDPRPVSLLKLVLLSAGTLFSLSCGYDDIPTPSTGTLSVETVTTGSGVDADGYTVVANNSAPVPIPVVGTVYLEDLDTGPYQVALGGLQENCETLRGTNPQTKTVLPGDTVGVTFNVTCVTPPPDPDGPPKP
jgi:hypothetical protein